jgi:hypothetical protein
MIPHGFSQTRVSPLLDVQLAFARAKIDQNCTCIEPYREVL